MSLLLAEHQSQWRDARDMAFAEPPNSRTRTDKAAKVLLDISEPLTDEAFEKSAKIVAAWRSAHLHPLAAFGELLDAVNTETGCRGLQSARLKRMRSILFKLYLSEKPMRLTQMQDIGGCRLVVDSIEQVKLIDDAFRSKAAGHELIDIDDYILSPKKSGYRSTHLIYRYCGKDAWNGLLIEVQIRSKLQHAWAAAVETVDKFSGENRGDIKAGRGDKTWMAFFRLMGAAIALKENCNPVPNTPRGVDLLENIRLLSAGLEVGRKLKAWSEAVRIGGDEKAPADGHHFLIKFDLQNSRVLIQAFKKDEGEKANAAYKAAEANAKELASLSPQILQDVVLVSVDKIAELREAYPSYFADTAEFMKMVEGAINMKQAIEDDPAC